MNLEQPQSKGIIWTGRVLSTVIVLFLCMGVFMGLSGNPKVAEGMAHYGFPPNALKTVLALEALSAILYAIPATAVLGAVVLTGYLGGAICTHLRAGEAYVIPIVFALVAWLGIFLREPRLRSLLPLRR
jgi:hypothetical protein